MSLDEETTRILNTLKGVDLSSADGRAGIGRLLAEIERRAPGAILQSASRIDLQRVVQRNVAAINQEVSR